MLTWLMMWQRLLRLPLPSPSLCALFAGLGAPLRGAARRAPFLGRRPYDEVVVEEPEKDGGLQLERKLVCAPVGEGRGGGWGGGKSGGLGESKGGFLARPRRRPYGARFYSRGVDFFFREATGKADPSYSPAGSPNKFQGRDHI